MTPLGKILAGLLALVVILLCVLFVGWLLSVLTAEDIFGQTVDIPLLAPGRLGMITNIGASEFPAEAMRYSLNLDISRPGVIRKRLGLEYYGPAHHYLWGATSYYNAYDLHRLIVGVHESTFVWFDAAGISNPSVVGHFFVSDTFATDPSNPVSGLVFPYRDTYHDWISWRDLAFHCDGKAIPIIITTSQTFWVTDSTDSVNNQISRFDTLGFEPRAVSLGLEAPGQLRVGLTDSKGPLRGAYKYSYAFFDPTTDSSSKAAIFSATIHPRNELPYLTQFESYEEVDSVMWKLILRQKQDASLEVIVIDTQKTGSFDDYGTIKLLDIHGQPGISSYKVPHDYLYWIVIVSDSLAGNPRARDSIGYLTEEFGDERVEDVAGKLADSINNMTVMADSVLATKVGWDVSVGSILPCLYYTLTTDTGITVISVLDSANITNLGTPLVYVDTLSDSLATVKWIPDTGSTIDTTIRTPGGLTFAWTVSGSSQATDNTGPHAYEDSIYPVAYSLFDPATGLESPLGPSLHVNLADSGVGADSIVFAALTTGWPASRAQWMRWYQGIVKTSLVGGGDTTIWYGLFQQRTNDSARTAVLGNWEDTTVTIGLDTSTITTDTLYEYQLFVGASGAVIQRPPYNYDLQIPFTQMRLGGDGRFYGIGDPACPTCVYYTPPDTIAWNPIDYFELGLPGGDEFVAMEELHGTIYLLAHKSFWYIPGFEAEIETPYGRIIDPNADAWKMAEVGAVSRETVVKYEDAIYFLTTKREVMVFDGELRELSVLIEDRIDSIFVDYDAMVNYGHLVGQYDAIKLSNDSTGEVLSIDIRTETWGHELFTNFTPQRMFIYDSVNTDVSEICFEVGTDPFLRQYRNGVRNDEGGNIAWAAEFPVVGDGRKIYSVEYLNLRMEPRSNWKLRYTIYDADGDSLVTDSIFQSTAGAYANNRFLRWAVNPHVPTMFPFVRLWGAIDPNTGAEPPTVYYNLFDIESITFTVTQDADFGTK